MSSSRPVGDRSSEGEGAEFARACLRQQEGTPLPSPVEPAALRVMLADLRCLLVSTLVSVTTLAASLPPTVNAQVPFLPAEAERIDVIAIERDGRDLYAFDALTGSRASTRLEVAEEVAFERSRGRVGMVLTNRRVLGVGPGTSWLEERLGLQEIPPEVGLVEDRLGLVVTDRRALAFVGQQGWVAEALSPNEVASAVRAGTAVGVVTTNRRALGIAASVGHFVSEPLGVTEVLESITTQDALVTLRTNRRILVFSAPRANWSVQKRKINSR